LGTDHPSVLLVEDHPMMGRMLGRFLRERGKMEVWATVQTAEAALERLASAGGDRLPDLILVDVSLPGMNGIALLVELGRHYPELPSIMLSASHNPGHVRQALANGARGFVAKGDAPAIVDAIRLVLDGHVYLSDAVRQAIEA
jgi:DNA-binding NarL/FixJ family response regulator